MCLKQRRCEKLRQPSPHSRPQTPHSREWDLDKRFCDLVLELSGSYLSKWPAKQRKECRKHCDMSNLATESSHHNLCFLAGEQIATGSRKASMVSRCKSSWWRRSAMKGPTLASRSAQLKQIYPCCWGYGETIRNTRSTAGNSMTDSERPSPEPLLRKEASPAVLGGREFLKCSGAAVEPSNALNDRAWGIPAVLPREIPGNALRAFPGSFRNFSGISSGKSQPYWGVAQTNVCIPLPFCTACTPNSYPGAKNQTKEEVLGRISVRTSSQKLRSGPPNPGKQALWPGRLVRTKLRSGKLWADFSFPTCLSLLLGYFKISLFQVGGWLAYGQNAVDLSLFPCFVRLGDTALKLKFYWGHTKRGVTMKPFVLFTQLLGYFGTPKARQGRGVCVLAASHCWR